MTKQTLVGWVDGGPTRSTFDIIWSCMSVVLVCTWKVLHLIISAREEIYAPSRNWKYWMKWARKLKWMFLMAVAPEFALAVALADYLWAKESVRKFQALNQLDKDLDLQDPSIDDGLNKEAKITGTAVSQSITSKSQPWTMVHAHYANMGGFIIRFPEPQNIDCTERSSHPFTGLGPNPRPDIDITFPAFPLFADQVFELVSKFSFQIPYVEEEDIEDRSKTDVFTKCFAILQSAWLVIQCIARGVQGLPITEMELATLGFVGCALFMYSLWWNKPFDVDYSINIDCPYEKRNVVYKRLREMFEIRFHSAILSPTWDNFIAMQRIPNWAYFSDLGLGRRTWLLSLWTILSSGACFSGLHAVAWNWVFPSGFELWLWRGASLFATAVCPIMAIIMSLKETGKTERQKKLIIGIVLPFWVLCWLSRATLIVQVFLCFRGMPQEVYMVVNWSSFIPHFS